MVGSGYAFIFESVYDNAIRISPRPLLNPGMEQVVYYQECNMLRRKEAATTTLIFTQLELTCALFPTQQCCLF